MEAPDIRKESSMTTKSVVSQVVEVVVNQMLAGAMARVVSKLKPERVQEWLAAHPEWNLDATGKVLQCTRTFPSAMAAAHFASFVSGLASSEELPALLKVIGASVHISLYSPHEQGPAPLTEEVLTLASHVA
jgi:pterin-4a-carbinolamine dehydratase